MHVVAGGGVVGVVDGLFEVGQRDVAVELEHREGDRRRGEDEYPKEERAHPGRAVDHADEKQVIDDDLEEEEGGIGKPGENLGLGEFREDREEAGTGKPGEVELAEFRQEQRREQAEHADGDRPLLQRLRRELGQDGRERDRETGQDEEFVDVPGDQVLHDLGRADEEGGVDQDENEKAEGVRRRGPAGGLGGGAGQRQRAKRDGGCHGSRMRPGFRGR